MSSDANPRYFQYTDIVDEGSSPAEMQAMPSDGLIGKSLAVVPAGPENAKEGVSLLAVGAGSAGGTGPGYVYLMSIRARNDRIVYLGSRRLQPAAGMGFDAAGTQFGASLAVVGLGPGTSHLPVLAIGAPGVDSNNGTVALVTVRQD